MFSNACKALIDAIKHETLDKFLEDVLNGVYGGRIATPTSSSSNSSSGSASGSGVWTGSYTQTAPGVWTNGNGNTTTVDPLSGIDWGRGVGVNGVVSSGSSGGRDSYLENPANY